MEYFNGGGAGPENGVVVDTEIATVMSRVITSLACLIIARPDRLQHIIPAASIANADSKCFFDDIALLLNQQVGPLAVG